LPSDFLYYQFMVKGYTYTVSRRELAVRRWGQIYPLLRLSLIDAPSRSGTLHITAISENDSGDGAYSAELHYKLPVEVPDIGETDCAFRLVTPFGTHDVERACTTARAAAQISLNVLRIQNGEGTIQALVVDQLGNPLEGTEVQFTAAGTTLSATTDVNGVAVAQIPQGQSTMGVAAAVLDSSGVSGSSSIIFLAGDAARNKNGGGLLSAVVERAPILLIVLLVSTLMMWLWRKRSAWLVLLLALALLPALSWAQSAGDNSTAAAGGAQNEGVLDVQATLDACRNYDFGNAVRHFGECAEAYQLINEFSSMRGTAIKLIENIGPLVVATPDIRPYRDSYANMVRIALALFRVAWAFNSLYLLLNIFNPTKRNEALKQYIWLIVFVIFAYFSFTVIQGAVAAVNSVSEWVAGKDAAASLTQATLSANFVSENYEMLKLVLPFLNFTDLVLLARYVTVIGMILFFPFSLLLYFTSATRGFGRAALTVTFAALGLGIINATLLLIYNILTTAAVDPALSGSFAATFFSASFIIFFGFVNLMVLAVAFLSGIISIGQSRGESG
ncbi:MAG: Ig-like domain-containing protein, partial [Sulfuricaulis sp.]|nr:Ig-like domain-containing protein [Sulfuricaulis sp.]